MTIQNGFIIVNTVNTSNIMGHWVLFFVDNGILFYFDSLGRTPDEYGKNIQIFYLLFEGIKNIVFKKRVQAESTLTCGAYCLVFAHMISNGYSLRNIRRKFGISPNRNERFVVDYLFNMGKFKDRCIDSFCPSKNDWYRM